MNRRGATKRVEAGWIGRSRAAIELENRERDSKVAKGRRLDMQDGGIIRRGGCGEPRRGERGRKEEEGDGVGAATETNKIE